MNVPSRATVRAGWVIVFLIIAAVLIVLGSVPAGAVTAAGHRGATGIPGVPEQSQKALRWAAEHGARIVEGDVQFTADDYAVMLHDTTLDRTTDCTGPISQVTFAELRKCAPAAIVPQLLFWLREAKNLNQVALVELKRPPTVHQAAVFARTVEAEAPARIVVSSFRPETLTTVRSVLGDRARYAPIIAPAGSPFGYKVADHAAEFDLILADYRWVIVARMHWYADAGVDVWLWTANSPAAVTRCKGLAAAEPSTTAILADDVRTL